MRRTVSAELDATIDVDAHLEIQVMVAASDQQVVDEVIELSLDGQALDYVEMTDRLGTRALVADAVPGQLTVRYRATVDGQAAAAGGDSLSALEFLRPSRYCESDRIIGFSGRTFPDLDAPADALVIVSDWVRWHLEYVSGSSGPLDGAVDTLLSAQGVCRDFAHLTIALLRAKGVPARLAAVYAPGLSPMDFHAVTEAFIDGAWYVVDPTGLAPRTAMLRIATGRDAADTSFLTNHSGVVSLDRLEITATVDGQLPVDDAVALVQLR